MIRLDYQTNNLRWGWRGIEFNSWDDYARVLGFLSNIEHYGNDVSSSLNNKIRIVIERNDEQGAWNSEGRIQYYGDENLLYNELPQLYRHSSMGVGNITLRVNSNPYVYDLVRLYEFIVDEPDIGRTASIYPTEDAIQNVSIMTGYMRNLNLQANIISSAIRHFYLGWIL